MALYCDKERKYNFCQKKMRTRMDRGSDEEWRRVKTVIYPAALYVDVFSIEDDGTEIRAFP